MSSISLKGNKPETFNGNRDFLGVNTWLYKIEQYLALTQISSPQVTLTDLNRITFASSYFSGNAAVWWFNIVQSVAAPTTWDNFKELVIKEFIPADHTRRAREKLRKLKQLGSVEKYVAEFRNTILAISDMHEGEKTDRFVQGLKYGVKVEVMKSGVETFDECARIAMNVDNAIWSAKRESSSSFPSRDAGPSRPVPMEIGNLNGTRGQAHREQRKKDLEKGACFRCHTVGCRPWKCDPSRVNNLNVQTQGSVTEGDTLVLSDSESEN